MAFNPFTRFRKHQKVFFAGLTIVCMITFILQFGRGDPFERILSVMGMQRARGEVVTTLYGKEVKAKDLQDIYQQRLLAGGLMTGTSEQHLGSFMMEVQKEGSKPEARQDPTTLQQMASRYFNRALEMMVRRNEMQRVHNDAVLDLQRAVQATEAPGLEKDPEQKARFNTAAQALAFQAWVSSFPPHGNEVDRMFYFGGSGRTADLLDFLIWKHQADQLGIALTLEDLCKELNRCFGKDMLNPDNFASNVEIYLSNNKVKAGATTNDLIKALSDEFRVVMAKGAFLGSADGVPGWRTQFSAVRRNPATVTPDEFLDYFRQQRTTVAVTLLPLSVERFRKQVKDTPSETTLRRFYEAYAEREPVPEQRVPGFKEPRRVRLAWFSYSPEEEFFKKKAAQLSPLPPLLRLGAGANNYAAGGGPAVWAVQAATLASDNRYFLHYGLYQEEERFRFGESMGVGFSLEDRHELLKRPEVAAGLVGQFAGASGLGAAGALMTPVSVRGMAALLEVKTLQSFGSAALAAGTGMPGTALTLPLPFVHTTLPLDKVLPRLHEKFEEQLAGEIAVQAVTALGKEMEKIKDPADQPAEVERILHEGAAHYGLQDVHVMKDLHDRYQLAEDSSPELEKLKIAYYQSQQYQNYQQMERRSPEEIDFLTTVFDGKGVNPPHWSEDLARRGDNTATRMGRSATVGASLQVFRGRGRTWMFWRIEDRSARVRGFEDVRHEVLQAWQNEQARVLARKDAERIVRELNERKGSASDAVRLLREQKGELLLELKNVARQVPLSRQMLPGGDSGAPHFKPYQLPPRTITYPSPDMLDRILAVKEPGQATWFTDQPQMHYYVSVLMEREVPSFREFAEVYRSPVSHGLFGADPSLWQQCLYSKEEEYRQKRLEQLRAEAGKVDDEGNLIVSEKARQRQDGSSEGRE